MTKSRHILPVRPLNCKPEAILKAMENLARREGCYLTIERGVPIALCRTNYDKILDAVKLTTPLVPLIIALVKK